MKSLSAKLIFQPHGKRLEIPLGTNILEAAREVGINISSICGGIGRCGKCRVIVHCGKESLSEPSESEKHAFSKEDLDVGLRLACQTTVLNTGKVVVEIPFSSLIEQQKLLFKGLERKVKMHPAVRKVVVTLEKPSLQDCRSDVNRLLDAAKFQIGFKPIIDFETLKKVPDVIREKNWVVTITVWNNREIIDVQPGKESGCYGFAIDIGTTKIAGYLLDLCSGEIVASASIMNPQIPFGEDVISRIQFIMENPKNLLHLQHVVVEGVNKLIKESCQKANVSVKDIYELTFAGNTVMHHIFLGIPSTYVALTPYSAALQSSLNVKAREISLDMCKGAYIYALPTIAGFVGGDAVADILATEIHKTSQISMLIDIGTNTEIVLGNKERLLACSCASGPAFEGAHIKHGMRASTGAIEHLWITPETLEVGYKTIDNAPPRGLCGSAIVDAVAEMLKSKLIDESGRFNKKLSTPRLRLKENGSEFVIAWKREGIVNSDIVITQGDIREVQLAKAAIYTGTSILMEHLGIKTNEIQKIFLAGAFGTYVDPQNAKIIGMYPDVHLPRVQFVGNTAGSGARMALLSVKVRKLAEKIAKSVEYVELGADPNFQNEFIKALYFPHQEKELFPSVSELFI